MALNKIPDFLLNNDKKSKGLNNFDESYLDKGIKTFSGIARDIYSQSLAINRNNFLSQITPVAKLIFLIASVVFINIKTDIRSELFISFFVYLLVMLSGINFFNFIKRNMFLAFVFGFLVSVFSIFSFITPGDMILKIFSIEKPLNLVFIKIYSDIGITKEGVEVCLNLTLRVFNSLSAAMFVVCTTEFQRLVSALKFFKVPDFFVLIVTLAYKYIIIFSVMIEDMFMARKSRLITTESSGERWWVISRISFILSKPIKKYEDVFHAMVARGFDGKIELPNPQKFLKNDYLFLLISILFLIFV